MATIADSPTLDPALRHWIHGFMLQTIIYGINVVIFLMSTWVLSIHIIKGLYPEPFHKHHLLQNSCLLLYSVVMFALSSILMARQGEIAGYTWSMFLDLKIQDDAAAMANTMQNIMKTAFGDPASFQRACSVTLVLVNWGAVGMLLWRCVLHWKVRSIFPFEIMIIPFLAFAASIATGLLHIIHDMGLGGLSTSAQNKDWKLIYWSISTGLYYLLAIMITVRVLYHRSIIQKEFDAKDVNKFAGYLSIAYDSGIVVLPFATAYLIALARLPHLIYVFQMTVAQNQVMLSLLIVQRLGAGRSWTGKTIDCILNTRRKAIEPVTKHVEEVTTMGFNPNTEISSTQNDVDSERSRKRRDRDLASGFQEAVVSEV